jgi:drug/metabolite transporter (DMT)-like permease
MFMPSALPSAAAAHADRGAEPLHSVALTLAPISIGQAVLAGGLVFLAVLAERFFGFELGRRQWIGIALVAVSLSLLTLTGGGGGGGAHSRYFGDRLGDDTVIAGIRIAAFALILTGAVLIPAPLRAGEALDESAIQVDIRASSA